LPSLPETRIESPVIVVNKLLKILLEHRRRFALAVVVVGGALIFSRFSPEFPREVELKLMLGPTHVEVTEVRLSCFAAEEEVRNVCFRFPFGAPFELVHRVSLPEGFYRLVIDREIRSGESRRVTGSFRVPADGAVIVRAY
jgi:hypothetical protein